VRPPTAARQVFEDPFLDARLYFRLAQDAGAIGTAPRRAQAEPRARGLFSRCLLVEEIVHRACPLI
jgi:hypothetical protein